MNLTDYLIINDEQKQRLALVREKYKLLYKDPENCLPMIIIDVPQQQVPTWEQQLADPLLMLKAQLDNIRPHLQIEDDSLPSVRVDFGTGQVAAAFGCPLKVPTNSLPAVSSPVLKQAQDVYNLTKPSLNAGWYVKLQQWTDIWLENLPNGVEIQHPDIQGPFNTAHLVRGNDILTDFYDTPEAVEKLLDIITDFMIDLVPHLKRKISNENDWFLDWDGALWKGAARISNCTTDLISPQIYTKYVLPHDARFFKAIGGGSIHYCGTSGDVIREFFKIPEITGLDVDAQYHDLWQLAEMAPPPLTLVCQHYGQACPYIDRLLAGDWPKKRNIIVYTEVNSVDKAKNLLFNLRKSITYLLTYLLTSTFAILYSHAAWLR